MPVVLIVLITLAVILIFNSLTKRLLPALIGGTLLLALWTGHDLRSIIGMAFMQGVSLNNVMLFLTIFQVMSLSRQMEATGVMKELVNDVRGKVSKRGAIAVLPGLIGFLPMPGGALFSAPMLQSCDQENQVDSGLKAQTNHWFRHIWECWWPMFPGVLLTMELTGFDVPEILMLGIPVSLAAIVSGYLLLLRRIPNPPPPELEQTEKTGPVRLLRLMSPIIVVIAAYALVRTTHSFAAQNFDFIPGLNRYVPINIGLVLAMLLLQYQRPLPGKTWKGITCSRQILNMILVVLAVRIYGGFIEYQSADGFHLIDQMRVELSSWGIPIMAVMMILPFVTALATGLAVGYIGASFPIVLSLIGEDPSFPVMMSQVVVAYGFGYMGFVLSPVHVCLVVSSDYFSTSVFKNVVGLLPPALMVMLLVLVISMLWNFIPL